MRLEAEVHEKQFLQQREAEGGKGTKNLTSCILPTSYKRSLLTEKKKTVSHSIGFGPILRGSIDQGRQHGKREKLSENKKITRRERGT
jgi:hypothetical protein